MTDEELAELTQELKDLRRLVYQHGQLSTRVHVAADRAIQALNHPQGEPRA